MPYPPGLHPGAAWVKIDFQCHSPRDPDWRDPVDLPGGMGEPEEARRAWADLFVREAKARGLDGIAVTDHHDVAFLPFVVEAARPADIVVFPGIEITCRDAVQCLAIFDPTCDQDLWQRLLSKLPQIVPYGPELSRCGPTRECGLTVLDLFEAIRIDPFLRDAVVLIPHFGPASAHKSLNQPGHAARFHSLPCDAVYVECHPDEIDQPTRDKIEGRISEWGTRRRAIIATGDNKRDTWERLGAHGSWIRLGEPSIESLRQAFLADEARISLAPPSSPAERIVHVEIQSSLTGVDPVRIVMNDGFTALIGGRGSGKSAVLEFIRFGLGKSEADLPADDPQSRRRRDRELALLSDTLKGGWVRLEIEREGVREQWTRTGDKPQEIVVVSQGDEERINVAAAQLRFPARAFHQKELSTTMVDPEAAADNITGIAAAEVIEERRRIDLEIVNAKRAVTSTFQELAGHWQSELELSDARSQSEDLRRRIASVTAKLAEGGVKPDDLAVLADAPRHGRGRNYLDEVERKLASDRDRVSKLTADLLAIETDRFPDVGTFLELASLDARIREIREVAVRQMADIEECIILLEAERTASAASFKDVTAAFDLRYAGAKERQASQGALIVDSERLGALLEDAEASEAKSAAKEAEMRVAIDRHSKARDALRALVGRRYALLQRAAEEVAAKSHGSLKARAKRDRRPAECISALCALAEGSRIRDPEQNCADWVASAFKADAAVDWPTTCNRLVELYRSKIIAGSPSEPGPELRAALVEAFKGGGPSLTDLQSQKVYANLSDQTVGLVLSAVPRDTIVLTYVSDGQDIPFERASPGQQASALLELLLGQSAGTLIVDQPEDDLDNKVIMRVVERIRTSKARRQLIFATHNPNLVVNGDADKVVSMVATMPEDRAPTGSARVKVGVDGAIETPAVRATITTVMEGGLEAFDLRARKYGVEGVGVRP